MRTSLGLLFSLSLLLGASAIADTLTSEPNAGVLDQPLPGNNTVLNTGVLQNNLILNNGSPEQINSALRAQFINEQRELKKLSRAELQSRAEKGERAAQVTLAEDFADEAALLTFAPEAANAALSDALFWYAKAASSGFPGAPSLDQAGVKFYPIRAQRSR
ncbi:MAG: hypothetical protein AB8B87_25800 [Granulosicoccus sp.]